jgi:hypothetical protein
LEPLLREEAQRRGCDVRYGTQLESFSQDTECVSATVTNRATGEAFVVRSEYLLAADGAHSHVRQALGIHGEGVGELDEHYVFVYFRAPWADLIRGHENDAFWIDRPGCRGFFLVTDPDRGMFLIQEESAKNYAVERCKELVLDGLGTPDMPVEIVDVVPWRPGHLVAERFQQGRVFLVGDAAHTMPPKLGLGVNTAIQSAQNLAWKLAAVLKGCASPELLSTYESERRPVGKITADQSLVGPAASLLTKGADDKLLPVEKRIPYFALVAGHRYRSSAIVNEEASTPIDRNGVAEPDLLKTPAELDGRPGTRVPHSWLEREGRRISTLDLLDGGFVLLTGAAGGAWQDAASAATAQLGIAIAIYRIGEGGDLVDPARSWREKFGVEDDGAVLVRPDGFVAWRCRTAAADPRSSLIRVLSQILSRGLG